jgi:hypothetical protein
MGADERDDRREDGQQDDQHHEVRQHPRQRARGLQLHGDEDDGARLDDEIRASHAAAARLSSRLVELCERTKSSEDARVKAKMQHALSQRDARALVQLLQSSATAHPLFDIDIQASDIILRSYRTQDVVKFLRVKKQPKPLKQIFEALVSLLEQLTHTPDDAARCGCSK